MASLQAGEVGSEIGDQIPERFLSRAMTGPRYSGVSLPRPLLGAEATMFAMAAVPDLQGNALCGLVLRIDPEREFTEILQRGRMGQSGESYAFNGAGQLISESRFDDDLRQIGLIPEGERGILNVEIRDPGGNLVEGFEPDVPREEQPLTLMASEATAGKAG